MLQLGQIMDNTYMREKILFWCLIALNALDVFLTSQILLMGGVEANPVVNAFITSFDHVGMVYIKGPFLLILGITLYFFWDRLSNKFRQSMLNILMLLNVAFIALNSYSFGIYSVLHT